MIVTFLFMTINLALITYAVYQAVTINTFIKSTNTRELCKRYASHKTSLTTVLLKSAHIRSNLTIVNGILVAALIVTSTISMQLTLQHKPAFMTVIAGLVMCVISLGMMLLLKTYQYMLTVQIESYLLFNNQDVAATDVINKSVKGLSLPVVVVTSTIVCTILEIML